MSSRDFGFALSHSALASSIWVASGESSYLSKSKWMSFSVPATAGRKLAIGTRVVEPPAAACRVLPSMREPDGPVIAVPSGDGVAVVVVAGVIAHPAARPTSRSPCTTSAVAFIAPLLLGVSFTALDRSRYGPAAEVWPTATAPPCAIRRASTGPGGEALPRRPASMSPPPAGDHGRRDAGPPSCARPVGPPARRRCDVGPAAAPRACRSSPRRRPADP